MILLCASRLEIDFSTSLESGLVCEFRMAITNVANIDYSSRRGGRPEEAVPSYFTHIQRLTVLIQISLRLGRPIAPSVKQPRARRPYHDRLLHHLLLLSLVALDRRSQSIGCTVAVPSLVPIDIRLIMAHGLRADRGVQAQKRTKGEQWWRRRANSDKYRRGSTVKGGDLHRSSSTLPPPSLALDCALRRLRCQVRWTSSCTHLHV